MSDTKFLIHVDGMEAIPVSHPTELFSAMASELLSLKNRYIRIESDDGRTYTIKGNKVIAVSTES